MFCYSYSIHRSFMSGRPWLTWLSKPFHRVSMNGVWYIVMTGTCLTSIKTHIFQAIVHWLDQHKSFRPDICTRFPFWCLCWGLLSANFNPILSDNFAGTGRYYDISLYLILQVSMNNPGEYGKKDHMTLRGTDTITTIEQIKPYSCAYAMGCIGTKQRYYSAQQPKHW